MGCFAGLDPLLDEQQSVYVVMATLLPWHSCDAHSCYIMHFCCKLTSLKGFLAVIVQKTERRLLV